MNKTTRILAISVAAVALIVVIAFVAKPKNRAGRELATSPGDHGQPQAQAPRRQNWPLLWGTAPQQCDKKQSQLTTSPVAVDDITTIQPMGELAQGHVVPGEHIGINYTANPATDGVKVYAPADGYIAMIERHQFVPEGGFTSKLRNYHVYMVHSCSLFSGFVHVTNIAPEILAANAELKTLDEGTVDSSSKNIWPNIAVKAGQVIGTANGFGLLGMVTVDLDTRITGYINTANYQDEGWRLNAVAPFDYFPKPIKEELLAKNLRKAEPLGGKFDLDFDGKLVGNWMEPGSGGIKGSGAGLKRCGNFPCPAQDGQITFVYDYIEPAQLRVSIGHNWGLSAQTPYGVKRNAPDFKDVGESTGQVKYELTPLLNKNKDHGIANEHPIATATDDSKLLGTLLVELTDPRRIKVEVFPDKSAAQVSVFTESARSYER